MNDETFRIRLILLLHDGAVKNMKQSRGLVSWLAELTGAEVLEAKVPVLTGAARNRANNAVSKLPEGNRRDARDWLALADGDLLVRQVGQWFAERNIHEGTREVLVVSSGETPAPYNLALGYMWRCSCATVSAPSNIGTEPFDFAIVPEYEFPKRKPNVLVTMGAPNSINEESVKREAKRVLSEFPPRSDKRWGIIIGGDDAYFSISKDWIKKNIGHILRIAESEGSDVYIATSANTSPDALKMLEALINSSEAARTCFIASECLYDPLPALFGLSDEVFCTEDLTDSVTEAITAGKRPIILRSEHRKGIHGTLQNITAALVEHGAVSKNILWGIPKNDMVYDHFARHGYVIDFREWLYERLEGSAESDKNDVEFNESKRAAQWIIDNWN
ncbi:MAG: ELM1/GtrOC1 family putative glycosyltransferase [Synergistaceae bacterium]|nr:ELM1/GtrOC1 family putative glycosyltransferase [Synergistaceae bacterium]